MLKFKTQWTLKLKTGGEFRTVAVTNKISSKTTSTGVRLVIFKVMDLKQTKNEEEEEEKDMEIVRHSSSKYISKTSFAYFVRFAVIF